jgi:hypothetical protein
MPDNEQEMDREVLANEEEQESVSTNEEKTKSRDESDMEGPVENEVVAETLDGNGTGTGKALKSQEHMEKEFGLEEDEAA